jgi:hypothetical protein
MSAGKQKRRVLEVGPSGVQAYFDQQVELWGGMSEVFDKGPGAKGRPDRVVTWPAFSFARIHFVELKTIGGELESWQERDHKRRRAVNCYVRVIWTKAKVDEYVREYGRDPHSPTGK